MTRRDFVKRGALWVPVAGLLTRQTARAAVTYFGNNSEVVDYENTFGTMYNLLGTLTCPGSGAQNVAALEAFAKITDDAYSAPIRLAIYTTAGAFVMQGSAGVEVSSATYSWKGHTAFVDQAGDPIAAPQLTGGSDYYLLLSVTQGWGLLVASTYIDASDNYNTTSYVTGGFPATLGGEGWTQFARLHSIRCGVGPPPAVGTRRRGRNPIQ